MEDVCQGLAGGYAGVRGGPGRGCLPAAASTCAAALVPASNSLTGSSSDPNALIAGRRTLAARSRRSGGGLLSGAAARQPMAIAADKSVFSARCCAISCRCLAWRPILALEGSRWLDPDRAAIAYRMVEGLPRPFTLEEAAKAEGYRLKRAQTYLADLPASNLYPAQVLMARRENEAARNLHAAVATRDDEADGSAATKTVRLKAIQVIEGNEGKASVTVNVNQQTSVAALRPGYVIRLPASRAEAAPAIDRAE
jgi:hypothetical protein